MINFDFNKHEDESEYAYKWRVYTAKAEGLLDDYDWTQLSAIIDANLRPDDIPFNESVYRKEAALVTKWYNNVFKFHDVSENEASIQEAINTLRKERVKLRDERSEINRAMRNEARLEHKLDYFEELIKSDGQKKYIPSKENTKSVSVVDNDGSDMFVLLSDWHIGSEFDSYYGQYNTDTAIRRLNKLMCEVKEHKQRFDCKNVYVGLLGDMLSGNIHTTVRINNAENVIEQIKIACSLVTDFIAELSTVFNKVSVASVCGNHSRIDKKDDALKDERLDDLIPFFAKSSLSHLNNVEFLTSKESTVGGFKIKDKFYVIVHGDYDDFDMRGISKLTMMLGFIPYCVCMGHLHTPSMNCDNGVKLIRCGSLCGTGDDYTISKRLTGEPSQTILICDKNGIKAHIPVTLKE